MSSTQDKAYNPCLTKQIYSYLRQGGSPGGSQTSLDNIGKKDNSLDRKVELENECYEYYCNGKVIFKLPVALHAYLVSCVPVFLTSS